MVMVDSPVPVVRRTPRELLIIVVAAATAINAVRLRGTSDPGKALAFAALALGFATRFFAMRVIATAVAAAPAGLHVAYAWRSGGDASELLGIAYFFGAILSLGGSALVAAFDDQPGRLNFWRELPRGDRRRL